MSAALVAPSPDADNRKRRFQQSSGECEEALPKRRYAEARRLLDWVAHLCQRYPLMSDKVRCCNPPLAARPAPCALSAPSVSALTLGSAHPQEITHVLDSCGGDVEAAIRRLDELSLSVAARDAAGAPGDAGQGGGAQADGALPSCDTARRARRRTACAPPGIARVSLCHACQALRHALAWPTER